MGCGCGGNAYEPPAPQVHLAADRQPVADARGWVSGNSHPVTWPAGVVEQAKQPAE